MTRRPGSPRRSLVSAAVAALAVALVGCGASASGSTDGDVGALDPATTELVVRFQDSSVPPQYHRSYELTVEGGEAHVVVDSYGDVIHDETLEVPADVWASFVADLERDAADVPVPEGVDDGCSGGTGIEVTVTDAGDERFERDVEDCGSDRNGEVADALEALIAPITEAVDLEGLTATE